MKTERMFKQRPRPMLSAVVITRNEERNLPWLLENLLHWVDEIVIVDDMSTDRTAEIAAGACNRVKFVRRAMCPELGYAGQRNAGIEAASGDWLLHLDCDERVPRPLASEILDSISASDFDAYRYRRLNFFMHRPMRHGGWTSWNRAQLARRGKHRFSRALHEKCNIEGGEDRIGQLQNTIAHLNEACFAERLKKSARYVEMTADEIEKSGKRITGAGIFLSAGFEFGKRYILQRGFLDGVAGLIGAMHAATSSFRSRALVWDRQNKIPRGDLERQFLWNNSVTDENVKS